MKPYKYPSYTDIHTELTWPEAPEITEVLAFFADLASSRLDLTFSLMLLKNELQDNKTKKLLHEHLHARKRKGRGGRRKETLLFSFSLLSRMARGRREGMRRTKGMPTTLFSFLFGVGRRRLVWKINYGAT